MRRPHPLNTKVQVYRNLHKNCFSLRSDRKVWAYAESVLILYPRFKVSEAGRQRVLREKRKNVHAFVEGLLIEKPVELKMAGQFTYNPYRHGYFYDCQSNWMLDRADFAYLTNEGNFYAIT